MARRAGLSVEHRYVRQSILMCVCLLSSVAMSQLPLIPSADPIELVDPQERISGNAITGLLLHGNETFAIGIENLWAYFEGSEPEELILQISSIDGRYFAEIRYTRDRQPKGWVGLKLDGLKKFSFLLDRGYGDEELAVLLRSSPNSNAAGPMYYPLSWARDKPDTRGSYKIRLYVNSERADTFIVEERKPVYCQETPGPSRFKFDAICEVTVETVCETTAEAAEKSATDSDKSVCVIDVFRRLGTSMFDPITLKFKMTY